ncbi:MAG: hypothetical protein GY952_08320 [Rhodobacteraceae bacterium]|nr:hypothetical protein [Paracoccaceae bacterium]
MSKPRYDPGGNPYDQSIESGHAAARKRLSEESGGISQSSGFSDTTGISTESYAPSTGLRKSWADTYARMELEKLRKEQDEIDEESLRLMLASYDTEHARSILDMRLELISQRMRVLNSI